MLCVKKPIALLLVGLAAAGCATAPRNKETAAKPAIPAYQPAAASALAFDSPVTPPYPLLGLDRDAREPGAFVGYQDSVTEIFATGFEDHQTNDPTTDQYDRWSYSTKVGVRYH